MWTIVNFFSIVHCVIDTGRLHFTGTQIRVYFSPLHVSWYVRWDARRWPGGILILVETKKRAHFFFSKALPKSPEFTVTHWSRAFCIYHVCVNTPTRFSVSVFFAGSSRYTQLWVIREITKKKNTFKWQKNGWKMLFCWKFEYIWPCVTFVFPFLEKRNSTFSPVQTCFCVTFISFLCFVFF